MAANASRLLAVGAICLCLMVASASAGTIYVKADATGANNGSSWTDAFTLLQPALDAAVSSDQIWVAAGIYIPTNDYGLVAAAGEVQARLKHFRLKNGVALYGGFAGVESGLEQRAWQANVTILSGDLNGNGLDPNDAYHVFYLPGGLALTSTTILDGFTITGGNADASGRTGWGGGIYNYRNSPTVASCVFWGNNARTGGAIANDGGKMMLARCAFSSNTARSGGAIWTAYFLDLDSSAGNLVAKDCAFRGNHAVDGGGIYLHGAGGGGASLTNCVFVGNTAEYGGAVFGYVGWVTITNSSFVANEADHGRVLSTDLPTPPWSGVSTVTIANSIIWNGSDWYFRNTPGALVGVSYSDVQGGRSGTGNIDSLPMFVRDPNAGLDGQWGTADDDCGDLRLKSGSLCIDTGNNAAIPVGITTDFTGKPRIVDGNGDGSAVVDMGARERQCVTGPIGDLLNDCGIDFADYAVLVGQWATTGCSDVNQWCSAADLDHSATVDIADLATLASHWMEGI